jgi:hypothetical protein
MAKTKYGKYIISQTGLISPHPHHTTTVWINDEMNGELKNAQYLLCEMVCKADDLSLKDFKPHNHDFNEYLVFLGTNPDDPYDLDGEVEIWLGDEEKHVITKSSTVFVPKGLYHTPIHFKKVNRPIIMFRTGDTLKYGNLSYSSDPKWKDHPLPPKPPESRLK